MKKYLSVSYDVCPVNDLYIDMNSIEVGEDTMDEEVRAFADKEKAPVVHVYELLDNGVIKNGYEYIKYEFHEYDCGCTEDDKYIRR